MVDPDRLWRYFDPDENYKLKLDSTGNPVLKEAWQVLDEAEFVPYDQSQFATKLFKLGDLPAGLMFTGISVVDNRAVRSIVSEFVSHEVVGHGAGVHKSPYTIEELARSFHQRIRTYYERDFPPPAPGQPDFDRPHLEFLVAGYDSDKADPTVARIDVGADRVMIPFPSGRHGVSFAGQMDWIQRIVFGTDNENKARIQERSQALLMQYREELLAHLKPQGVTSLPEPSGQLDFFNNWDLNRLMARWGDFSEQSAIDCVNFFLRTMIDAQNFDTRLPTVGGNVHIAVIRKATGFHPVTKEVWRHGSHEVQIPEVGQ